MPTTAQVTIRMTSGISADFITNQFAFTGEVATPTDAASLVTAFKDFYDDIAPSMFQTGVERDGHIVKLYDAGGVAPNYPFYESTFNLTSVVLGTQMPTEVALCLSFQGSRVAGEPQARKRGRIYLGPLDTAVSLNGRPSSTVITTMLDAAEAFYDNVDAIASAGSWAVWSPTTSTAVPLTEAWVDDAFDTQRSRGLARSSRTTRSLI